MPLVHHLVLLASSGSINTAKVYEELYANHGYHNNPNLTHSKGMLAEIDSPTMRCHVSKRGVLDVGCSHGYAVANLWQRNIRAAGMDIAPSAIALARQLRKNATSCPDPNECFKVGTATSLPWPDGSFDAIMSTDVLEHLLPGEEETMAREFVRVARRLLFLVIPGVKEGDLRPVKSLHKTNDANLQAVSELHTSRHTPTEWRKYFQDLGCIVLKDTSTDIAGYAPPKNKPWRTKVQTIMIVKTPTANAGVSKPCSSSA
jgi:SAM-dependent methyltransferase